MTEEQIRAATETARTTTDDVNQTVAELESYLARFRFEHALRQAFLTLSAIKANPKVPPEKPKWLTQI